jgi:hypothetical protein
VSWRFSFVPHNDRTKKEKSWFRTGWMDSESFLEKDSARGVSGALTFTDFIGVKQEFSSDADIR